ncbi:MAG: hypothetical protein WBG86_06240 [Polyangiales bacterium]
MGKSVRRLRHWKQRFNADAKFVWRKALTWHGKRMVPGELVSDEIIEQMGRTKLRRFWESHAIELHEFEAPDTSRAATQASAPAKPEASPPPVEPPAAVSDDSDIEVEDLGGSWFSVTIDGESQKVRGKQAVEALTGRPFAPDSD